MSTKNYNMNAELGVDDMEVCSELNLDAALAYTPGINAAALQEVYNQNIVAINNRLLREGMDPEEATRTATADANTLRDQGEKAMKTLYKQRKNA